MGKRELLLVFAFLVVGVVVYQATARPPAEGERGLSFSRMIESARRGIRGNRASAETTTIATHALTADVGELRLTGPIAEVEVIGEDRQDVETAIHVESTGYDQAEATEYVKQSKLVADRTASALILRMEFPRGGRQRGTLTVKVPARLHVRVEPGPGVLKVSNVAAVELSGTRGDVTLRKIQGRVELNHRSGDVDIDDVGALELTGRSAEVKIANVHGDTSIRMEQGGNLTASGLAGSVDVDSRNCDVRLDDMSAARGPVRINANGGSLRVRALKADTRIDSRGAEVEVAMAAPAPVAIYAEGDRVTLIPPAAGYSLDARVIEGRVSPDAFIAAMGFNSNSTGDKRETRVYGAFKGGGPTISVRATRADFTVRDADSKTTDDVEAPATIKPRLKSTLK